MTAWEQALRPTARQVLHKLREKGRAGATTTELCQPDVGGISFGTRIAELRRAGCEIEQLCERKGRYRYWIHSEPREVVQTPSGSQRADQDPDALFELEQKPVNAALSDPDLAA